MAGSDQPTKKTNISFTMSFREYLQFFSAGPLCGSPPYKLGGSVAEGSEQRTVGVLCKGTGIFGLTGVCGKPRRRITIQAKEKAEEASNSLGSIGEG